MSVDLAFSGAAEAGALLASGDVSSVELTRAAFAQADGIDERLALIVHRLEERAMQQAKSADERRGRGQSLSPLDGVPFTLKDLIDVEGVPTEAGSRVLAGNVAARSATAAARLEDAGAVLLAKVRTHEFAFGGTTLPTRNAWDAGRIPGGSSGGSGSSVASGFGAFSLGTDSAGSVRSPATFNGVVGLKPTYGKIGRSGVVPLAWTLDTVGVLARSIADVALVYDAIAGPDPLDHTSIQTPHEPVASALERDIAGLRVGVPDAYFFETIQDAVSTEVKKGLDALEAAGAELVPITLMPEEATATALTAAFVIIAAEAAAWHGEWLISRRGDYGEDVLRYLEMGSALSATTYVDAQRSRQLSVEALNDAMRTVDVIATPGQGHIAPRVEEETVEYDRGVSAHRDPAGIRNLAIVNLAGLPALIVPTGLAKGLPAGIQLIGPPCGEAALLCAGMAIESRVGFRGSRPAIAGE